MKILYLMHVDWNWIKQRPHFIAEGLAKQGFEVDVIYKKQHVKNNLVDNGTFKGSLKSIPSLRGGDRFKIIGICNRIIYLFFLHKVNTKKYDYVFLSHPKLFARCIKSKIIYDCMDDYAAFSNTMHSGYEKNILLKSESALIKMAKFVIFSSEFLQNAVTKRYGNIMKKSIVVNNAISLPNITLLPKKVEKSQNLVLTYIGTISDWFDFELLRVVKERFNTRNIIFNLYGPCENKPLTLQDFNFLGPIKHDDIFEVMSNSDILIMPFILTDLIKSVNPVKLYEYIFSGRPVITLKYGETEKFSDYVYLYEPSNADSFIKQLNLIIQNNLQGKVSHEAAIDYVKHNTWENRIAEIMSFLE